MVSKYRKICVTGGAGFIGSHLVDRLLNDGYEVIAVDNLLTGKLENIAHNLGKTRFQYVNCDIRDSKSIKNLIKDVDAIFHQAALTSIGMPTRKPTFLNSINVSGTLNLLETAAESKVKRFVYASSAAVYGDVSSPQREDMTPKPTSFYGFSKLVGENYVKLYHETYGLDTVCLRYFNVYGLRQNISNQYSDVITKFIGRLLSDKHLIVYGDGVQSRDFISVKDVVEANLLALESKNAVGESFNIGTGTSTSIRELAKMLLKLMNKNDAKILYSKPRPGDIRYSLADITKAKKILGFSPKHACMHEEELSQLVERYKNQEWFT